MKIIRKNARGGIIEEIEVTNVDIIKDAIVIKEPVFKTETVKVKDVKVVEEPYPVKVPNFIRHDVFYDKLIPVEKKLVIGVPNTEDLENTIDNLRKKAEAIEQIINNIKIKNIPRTIIEYNIIKKDLRVPNIKEYDRKVPKIIEVDTSVPKIIEEDYVVQKLQINTKTVDHYEVVTKELNTCIVNHLCPHCGKKSVDFLKDKKKKDDKG